MGQNEPQQIPMLSADQSFELFSPVFLSFPFFFFCTFSSPFLGAELDSVESYFVDLFCFSYQTCKNMHPKLFIYIT